MLDPAKASEAASTALDKWPVVQGFFMIVITFLGLAAWWRGERDGKSIPSGNPSQDFSSMLMQHDAAKSISQIERTVEKQTAILIDIAKSTDAFNRGQEHTHLLLNDVVNNQSLGLPLERAKAWGHGPGTNKRRTGNPDSDIQGPEEE